jgi:hypothetical protein
MKMTTKEQAVIDQIKLSEEEDSYAGLPIPDLIGVAGMNNMQAVGGVIGSLLDKRLVYIQNAKEYSLGCDCVAML